MFQDSVELCSIYNRLFKENELIKSELGKVDVLHTIYIGITSVTTKLNFIGGGGH
jgi:hypothetical protein